MKRIEEEKNNTRKRWMPSSQQRGEEETGITDWKMSWQVKE